MSSTADYIKKLVDSAPPLTPEQRDRLAVLLRPDMSRSLSDTFVPRRPGSGRGK